MANWMTGLGAGIQGFGQALGQVPLLQDQARQQAIENALRQAQFEESQRQHQAQMLATQRGLDLTQAGQERQAAQFGVENTPGGSLLPPEVRALWERQGFGQFAQPEGAITDPANLPVQTGLTGPGPMGLAAPITPSTPGAIDTGRGTSIPTENSSVRRAAIQAEAAMARRNQTAMERQALQTQRMQMQQQLQEARLKDPLRAQALTIRLKQLDIAEQELARKEQADMYDEMYRWGVQAPNVDFMQQYRTFIANNPTTEQYEAVPPSETKPLGGLRPVPRPKFTPLTGVKK